MHRFSSLLALLLLASCATLSADKGNTITRPFTAVDTDKIIVLSPNRTFEIVLPSNPETGCDWDLVIDHPEVVSNAGHRYEPDRGGRECVGGLTTWFHRTRQQGDALLTFKYQLRGEVGSSSSRIVTFRIVVR